MTRFCVGLSTSVDVGVPDRALRRWCRAVLVRGAEKHGLQRHPSPAELRGLCAEARERGWAVFPPCDSTNPDGSCAGHPTEGAP